MGLVLTLVVEHGLTLGSGVCEVLARAVARRPAARAHALSSIAGVEVQCGVREVLARAVARTGPASWAHFW